MLTIPTVKYNKEMINENKPHWAQDAFFYHIYPLGFCGAPNGNNFHSHPVPRLDQIHEWIPHLKAMGINAIYLGPLFESGSHGYDTVDYFKVDRRLGDNLTLKALVAILQEHGIKVILDAVFNHVGREFKGFKDIRQNGKQSKYRKWFDGLTFGKKRSPAGDPFTYKGWKGHYDLVKLDLNNEEVKTHLFKATKMWIEEFGIDGLRLDAADCMDLEFLKELTQYCKSLKSDFWLVGEIVMGDYAKWANPDTLDSVTNYECYKGLYSSHNEKNYFEIAHSLKRQFGPDGVYQGLPLYNFIDNHDVNRIGSTLKNSAHLYPIYALLMTMPGVPSIYYGSEWGINGEKLKWSDHPLRPQISLPRMRYESPHPDLIRAIQSFAQVRAQLPSLRYGNYNQVFVDHEQLVFSRQFKEECVVVAVNASSEAKTLTLELSGHHQKELIDHLNSDEKFLIEEGRVKIDIPSCWARVMVLK